MPGTPEHSSWKEAELVLGTAIVCLAKKATTAYLNPQLPGISHSTHQARPGTQGCKQSDALWAPKTRQGCLSRNSMFSACFPKRQV